MTEQAGTRRELISPIDQVVVIEQDYMPFPSGTVLTAQGTLSEIDIRWPYPLSGVRMKMHVKVLEAMTAVMDEARFPDEHAVEDIQVWFADQEEDAPRLPPEFSFDWEEKLESLEAQGVAIGLLNFRPWHRSSGDPDD